MNPISYLTVIVLSMSLKKYNAFDHATHNLNAHHHIGKAAQKFSDWEITTAFYASLKFFEGSLFPCVHQHPSQNKESDHFDTYNDYKRAYNRFVGGTPHDCMKHFVKYNTPDEIWIHYEELYDVCYNSRHKNYQIDPKDLQIAKTSLEAIRQYCIKNQK